MKRDKEILGNSTWRWKTNSYGPKCQGQAHARSDARRKPEARETEQGERSHGDEQKDQGYDPSAHRCIEHSTLPNIQDNNRLVGRQRIHINEFVLVSLHTDVKARKQKDEKPARRWVRPHTLSGFSKAPVQSFGYKWGSRWLPLKADR